MTQSKFDGIAAYIIIGYFTGATAGAICFFGGWVYCVAEYGFLVGVPLGWLPSWIIAVIAYGLGRYAWPIYLLGAWLIFG